MAYTRTWTIGLGLLVFVQSVKSSSTCVEKFADGKGANEKRIFNEGERVELKCDVSARGPKDVVYWKYYNNVMSQDDTVVPKYTSKFNVTLVNNIYSISWIAQRDDVGIYNCTCATGGIQYPLWIKRPCNKQEHVVKMMNITSGLNMTLGETYSLGCNQVLNFGLSLDCDCTWPEVKREFKGKWCRKEGTVCQTEDKQIPTRLKGGVTGHQDSSRTPIGCYTGHGGVTYRYRDVYGDFKGVEFECDSDVHGTFCFYIDEGESGLPGQNETLICVNCSCPPKTPTPKPAPIGPPCGDRILTIVLIVCGILCLLGIILLIVSKKGKLSKGTAKHLNNAVIGIALVVIVCLLVVIGLKVSGKLPAEYCKGLHVGLIIGTVFVLLVAVMLVVVPIILRCKKPKPPDQVDKVKGQVNASFSDVTTKADISTLPLKEQQPTDQNHKLDHRRTNGKVYNINQNSTLDSIDRKLDPTGPPRESDVEPERKSKLADHGISSDYDDVPPPRQQMKEKQLCSVCLEKPVNGYFEPCRHSEICDACARVSLPYNCSVCGMVVTAYVLFSNLASPMIWRGRSDFK